MSREVVNIDPIRSLAFGSISATYTKVGASFANPVRLITFVNATDGDMFFSDDGINDKLFLPAGTFKLLDLNTNHDSLDTKWVFPIGTQFWVRYSSSPSKNAVYIECLWGVNV